MQNATPRKIELFSKATIGYLLHIVHLLTVIGTAALCIAYMEGAPLDHLEYHERYQLRSENSQYAIIKLLIIIASLINLIYSWTFLYAPRFAIKGRIIWKTSPWLFSGLIVHGLPLFVTFYGMSPFLYCSFFPISLVMFVALYLGVFMHMENPMVDFLRPYVYTIVNNPHDSLENATYGPPHVIQSSFKGQPHVTMSYDLTHPLTMSARKYNSSGVTIIILRLCLGLIYMLNVNRFRVDVWTEPAYLVHVSLCVMDFLSTASLLLFPKLTCEGNGYLRCLPFLFISLSASISSLYVPLGLLEDAIDFTKFHYPEGDRMPYITSAFIMALVMYGGIASPLKITWTQIFKPFVSADDSKTRRRSSKKDLQ